MAFKGRDIALAGVASFVAWGYAVHWVPTLQWVGYAFVTGALLTTIAFLALILLISRGTSYRRYNQPVRPRTAAFLEPASWKREVAALKARQTYTKTSIIPESPIVSAALDQVLDYIVRDFVQVWYSHISKNPAFTNEVDRAIRHALLSLRERLFDLDPAEVLTTRLVPILTAHFHDFSDAERSVRGRKLNRSVTETEELDLAIAAKYRGGKLHPATSLAFADTKTAQQDYLRQLMSKKVLPRLLPEKLLTSSAVSTIIREIVSCAVMSPVMQLLAEPDTWNQIMENYGRTMLQDRSTVRKLRAALDQHASPAPRTMQSIAFPRLTPQDSERKFEKFIRAIRKVNNLSDARRFRSEVASQLKRDGQQEGGDQVYLRRLEMGKNLLDQKVQYLAVGSDRRHLVQPQAPASGVSRLETAPLEDLLRDPSGLSYFMEYMDRHRLMPLVQFWLVVDGLRNPLEDDGPEGSQLPLQLPPWTTSDRLDLAQIDAAYLAQPELKVPESSKQTIREFLKADKDATPEQYYRARRAILRAQTAVLEEMRTKHYPHFKKTDLFFKALAAEDASMNAAQAAGPSLARPPVNHTASSSNTKPTPVTRFASHLHPSAHARRSGSTSSLKREPLRRSSLDTTVTPYHAVEDDSPTPLFDDDDLGEDLLADSVQSLDQEGPPVLDRQVVQAVEEALSSIMEDSRPPTSEDLRASLFGDEVDDAGSGIFPAEGGSKRQSLDEETAGKRPSSDRPSSLRGSVDLQRPPMLTKDSDKPSLASLGLVSAASRIGVFEDNDLFADEDKNLADERDDLDEASRDDDMHVHEAAPGDLGLAEAITVLSNDIDRLATQDAVVVSLLKKAELTNNTAELRILRKSKASLEREMRRKELQRQQYVMQESDNSLYGRSTIRIESIKVGRDSDGKEYALYVIQVSRNAGEKMPAATWLVTRRYSEFLELHQSLRSRYPSVRHLDFPRRRMVMKLQSEFLKKRRIALEAYLRELLLLPDVCRSRDLRAFLSQSVITTHGQDLVDREDKKDMITRLYDSVTDGMEDILGSIPVLDQLSVAGQNLIAAATNQLGTMPGTVEENGMSAAEAEAELSAFENKELEPFVKPICDIFLEIFELNRGNNWLRGRAVVVVLHQLLGGTIERKLRDIVKLLAQEQAVLRYIGLLKDAMWPGGELVRNKVPRTAADKSRTRTEASLMLATLIPDLAGSVVGRLNAQAASRRIFATLNNSRLNAHLVFTLLDEIIDILFEGE